jgi:hypothetical protein
MVRARSVVVTLSASMLVMTGCSEDSSSSTDASTSSGSTSPSASTSAPTPATDSATDTPSDSASPTSPSESQMPDESSPTGPQQPSDLPSGGVTEEVRARASVQAAVQDLAARTETDVANIVLVGYAEVTWPDGSLGCPQPGRVYSQAVVPGQQLVLTVADGADVAATGPDVPTGLVSYHAGRQGTFTWCPNPRPALSRGSGST